MRLFWCLNTLQISHEKIKKSSHLNSVVVIKVLHLPLILSTKRLYYEKIEPTAIGRSVTSI